MGVSNPRGDRAKRNLGYAFPTRGMTVLRGTEATPRFRLARSPRGLETPIYTRTLYWILFLAQHRWKITFHFI